MMTELLEWNGGLKWNHCLGHRYVISDAARVGKVDLQCVFTDTEWRQAVIAVADEVDECQLHEKEEEIHIMYV